MRSCLGKARAGAVVRNHEGNACAAPNRSSCLLRFYHVRSAMDLGELGNIAIQRFALANDARLVADGGIVAILIGEVLKANVVPLTIGMDV
jgi:hypothetical protein